MSDTDELAPTGRGRVSINLGNPVLAQDTAATPRGIAVDLARDLSQRLRVPLHMIFFDAARDSFAAVQDGAADICFLAIETARENDLFFTAPYVILEGVFAAPQASPLVASEQVDATGVRVGVKNGSAYDLYLTRTLQHAELVRNVEGTTAAELGRCEIAAGIRAPLTHWVQNQSSWRVLEPAFMVGADPAVTRSGRRWSSLVLHRMNEPTAHSTAGLIAAALILAWVVYGVVIEFPGWWENALFIVSSTVTLVLVFAIQHTQARQQTATQRKLDELLRAIPRADNRLIAVEEAPDHELEDLANRDLATRDDALDGAERAR